MRPCLPAASAASSRSWRRDLTGWGCRQRSRRSSGFDGSELLRRIAQRVAASPYRFDIVFASGRLAQLLAQLAHENVDDLRLRLVHAAIEVVEEHLLGERGP